MATASMVTLLSQHPLLQSGARCRVQSSSCSGRSFGAAPLLSGSTRLLRTDSQRRHRVSLEAGGKQERVHFQRLPLSDSPGVLKRTTGDEAALPFATVSVVARQAGLPPPKEDEGLVTEAGPIGILDPDNKELWLSKVEWVDPRVDIDPVSIRRGARLQLRTAPMAALSEQTSRSDNDNLVTSVRNALPPSIRNNPLGVPGLSAAVLLVLALIWTLFRKKDEVQEKAGVSTPYGNSPPGGTATSLPGRTATSPPGRTGVLKKGDTYSALQRSQQDVSYKLGGGAKQTEQLVSRFIRKTESAVEKAEDVAKDVADEAAKKTQQSLAGLRKEVDKVKRSDDKLGTVTRDFNKAAEPVKDVAKGVAEKGKEAAQDVNQDVKERVENVRRSDDKLEATKREASKAAEPVKDAAKGAAERGKEAAKDAIDDAKKRVEKVKRSDDKVEATTQEVSKVAEKGKEAAKNVIQEGRKEAEKVKESDDKVEATKQEVSKAAGKGKEAVKDVVEDGKKRADVSTGRSETGDGLKAQVEAPKSEEQKAPSRGFWDILNRKGNQSVVSGVKDAPTRINEELVKAAVGDPAAKLSATPLPEKSDAKSSDAPEASEQPQKGGTGTAFVSDVEGSDTKAPVRLVKSAVGKPAEQQSGTSEQKPPSDETSEQKPETKGARELKSASDEKTEQMPQPKATWEEEPPAGSATSEQSNGKPSLPPLKLPKAGGTVDKPASKGSAPTQPQARAASETGSLQDEFEALSKLVGEPESAERDPKQESMQVVVSELSQAIEQSKQALLEAPGDVAPDKQRLLPDTDQEEDGTMSPSARLARDISSRFGTSAPARPPADISSFLPKPEDEDDDDGSLTPSEKVARDIAKRFGTSAPARPPADVSSFLDDEDDISDGSLTPSEKVVRDIAKRFGTSGPARPLADVSRPSDEDDNDDGSLTPSEKVARDIAKRFGTSAPARPPADISSFLTKPDDDEDASLSPSEKVARDIAKRFGTPKPLADVSSPPAKPAADVSEPDDDDSLLSPSAKVARDISQRSKSGGFFPADPPADIITPSAKLGDESDDEDTLSSPSAKVARDIRQRSKQGSFFPTDPPADIITPSAKLGDESDDQDTLSSPSAKVARDIRQRSKSGAFFPTNPPADIITPSAKPDDEDDHDDSLSSPSAKVARDIRQRSKSGGFFPADPPANVITPSAKPDDEDDNGHTPSSPSLKVARDIRQRSKSGSPYFPGSRPADVSAPSAEASSDVSSTATTTALPPPQSAPSDAPADKQEDLPSKKGFFADILTGARKFDIIGTTPSQPLSGSAGISVTSSVKPADVIETTPGQPLNGSTSPIDVSVSSVGAISRTPAKPADLRSAPAKPSAEVTSSPKPSASNDEKHSGAKAQTATSQPDEKPAAQSDSASKPVSKWWGINRTKSAMVTSPIPTDKVSPPKESKPFPSKDPKPSPIASAASQAPTKPLTGADSKPLTGASKPSGVTPSTLPQPQKATAGLSTNDSSRASREGSNGASNGRAGSPEKAGDDPVKVVEKIFVEDLPLPKLSEKSAAMRRRLVAKLQNVLPAVAVSIGAAGAITGGGIDGALETVGFTALASFATSTLLWANDRERIKKELEEIKSSKDVLEFLKEKAD